MTQKELVPSMSAPANRSIPSLDGLRAVSIGMVILSHYLGWANLPTHGLLHTFLAVVGQGGLGVSTFFVISGFLITTLLLRELDRESRINMRRFYFRRLLRIFPPYYLYLGIVTLAAWHAHVSFPQHALLASLTYTSDYYPYILSRPESTGWYLGHTWSLSVEEQFYLFWPMILAVLHLRTVLRIAIAILLLTPILRLVTVAHLPIYSASEQWFRLFHTNIDILVTGGLLAIWLSKPHLAKRLRRWTDPKLVAVAGTYLLFYTFLLKRAPLWFTCIFGIPLTSLSIALIVAFVVTNPSSYVGRVLNTKLLKHVGVISYGLYLWQQFFLGPYRVPSRLSMVLLSLACAELSFWCLERPILRHRAQWEENLGLAGTSTSKP